MREGGENRMAEISVGAIVSKGVTTNDGVRLHYLEAGVGKPLDRIRSKSIVIDCRA